MGLPLFKGASYDRMQKTVGSCRFHFLKYLPGALIFNAGDPCDDIAFVLSGSVRIITDSHDGRFTVSQTIASQDVISAEFLFGRNTRYPGKVVAIDTVSILRISKSDYISIINSDPVFLFNYLNLLSMNAQKALEGILSVGSGGVAERIAYWVSALTQTRSTDIVLECSHRDLAALFGVPRTTLKNALDDLKDKGLIDYTPTQIHALDRRGLIALLYNHAEPADV